MDLKELNLLLKKKPKTQKDKILRELILHRAVHYKELCRKIYGTYNRANESKLNDSYKSLRVEGFPVRRKVIEKHIRSRSSWRQGEIFYYLE